ncbi:MAG: META domain-containing protein [Roseovarius sp.]
MGRYVLVFLLALGLIMPAHAQEAERPVSGSLIYLPRIALPEDAEVAVQVEGAFGAILGETRFATGGAQVPLPFELSIVEGLSGQLSALIRVEGAPWWLVEDVAVPAEGAVELGELKLTQYVPLAFVSQYDCGGTSIVFGMADDTPTLRVDGRDYALSEAKAASGARYVGDGVEFWSKGDEASVTLDGAELPLCKVAGEVERYTARGNEPGWHVTIGEEEIELVADYGEITHRAPRPEVQVMPGAYVFDIPAAEAVLKLEERLCHDSATGMPYPHAALLEMGERVLVGCGGDPESLLSGAEWQVEDVAGGGIVDGSNITIGFDGAGRVYGGTGCNRFMGGYTLTGEGLEMGQMGVTMMACAEALMAQEQRVLDALGRVARFDIDETGALELIGADGAVLLLARRG